MGPAYFVIAILGCADGGTQCTPVAMAPTHYATEEQCAAATGAALMDSQPFDYPTLVAQCRSGKAPLSSSKDGKQPAPARVAVVLERGAKAWATTISTTRKSR